jgi:hypothetical protein
MRKKIFVKYSLSVEVPQSQTCQQEELFVYSFHGIYKKKRCHQFNYQIAFNWFTRPLYIFQMHDGYGVKDVS